MTTQKFFGMLEQANEFKTMIGEQKLKIMVDINVSTIDDVYTYKDFEEKINNTFAPKIATDILMADIQKTNCVREFKITYISDGMKNNVKLYVD